MMADVPRSPADDSFLRALPWLPNTEFQRVSLFVVPVSPAAFLGGDGSVFRKGRWTFTGEGPFRP
jgi:hypothetical protein